MNVVERIDHQHRRPHEGIARSECCVAVGVGACQAGRNERRATARVVG
jgi:hypothetical protein